VLLTYLLIFIATLLLIVPSSRFLSKKSLLNIKTNTRTYSTLLSRMLTTILSEITCLVNPSLVKLTLLVISQLMTAINSPLLIGLVITLSSLVLVILITTNLLISSTTTFRMPQRLPKVNSQTKKRRFTHHPCFSSVMMRCTTQMLLSSTMPLVSNTRTTTHSSSLNTCSALTVSISMLSTSMT